MKNICIIVSLCCLLNAFSLAEAHIPPSVSLMGVIKAEKPSLSIAIINEPNLGKTKILRIGETYQGFKLAHVLFDRIILQKGRFTWQIFLEKDQGEIRNQVLPTNQNLITDEKPEAFHQIPKMPGINTLRKNYKRSKIESRINQEWQKIIWETGLKPFYLNGTIQGLKLTKLPQPSLLYDLSIRKNDVIKEINGTILYQKQDLLDLYITIRQNNRFEVLIQRGMNLICMVYVLD